MKTDIKQMKCGNCGCGTAEVYIDQLHDNIGLECTKCNEITWITVDKPVVRLKPEPQNSGSFTVWD